MEKNALSKEELVNENHPLLKRWSEELNQIIPEMFIFVKSNNKEQDFDGVYVRFYKTNRI